MFIDFPEIHTPIQGIDLVVIVIITEFVVCSFHKFYTIIVK